jgi:protein TonB
MSQIDPMDAELPAERDSLGDERKPFISMGGSLIANIVIWSLLAVIGNQVVRSTQQAQIDASRIVVENKKQPKPPPPKPSPKAANKPTAKVKAQARKSVPTAAPRLLTSGPATSGGPSENTAVSGNGKAGTLGTGNGNGKGNGEETKQPTPPPPTLPTPPTKPPEPPPVVTPPVKPTPPPPVIPKPVGESRDAEATDQIQPQIPDNLRNEAFKGFARIRVDIGPDGRAALSLNTSCGNADFDRLVLEAVRKWKWKPALKEGEPVASVQFVRINIEVD